MVRRRAVLNGVGAAMAGALAGCVTGDAPRAARDWRRGSVTDARTGHSPGAGPTAEFHTAWRQGTGWERLTSPVLADGAVYVGGERRTDDGNREATVGAVDADDGTVAWTVSLGQREREDLSVISDSLVVAGDRLFVQADAGLAMVSVDGELQWTVDTVTGTLDLDEALSPVVTDHLVVTGTYGPDDGGDGTAAVVALDPRTGEERWRTEFPDLAGMTALAERGGVVYVPFFDDGLVALDLATGAELWRVRAPVDGPPTVAADVVLVPVDPGDKEGDDLVAVARGDPAVRWRRRLGWRGVHAGAAVADGRVFVCGNNGLESRSLATGEVLWRFGADHYGGDPPDATPYFETATPVVAGGTVYAYGVTPDASAGGVLFAFDAASGTELGRTAVPSPPNGSRTPAISEELVFLAGPLGGAVAARGACRTELLGHCLDG